MDDDCQSLLAHLDFFVIFGSILPSVIDSIACVCRITGLIANVKMIDFGCVCLLTVLLIKLFYCE